MTAPSFAVRRTCRECPWLRDVPPGKFPPERFRELADTAKPGGIRTVFACHMTPEGGERACAGFLLACGRDSNQVRLAQIRGTLDLAAVEATGPIHGSYREMAIANGVDADDPALDGLPPTQEGR